MLFASVLFVAFVVLNLMLFVVLFGVCYVFNCLRVNYFLFFCGKCLEVHHMHKHQLSVNAAEVAG